MTRLLLLATLLATGASAQTPLASLYGPWERTDSAPLEAVREDGTQAEFMVLYEALEISADALTSLTVSARRGSDEMLRAGELRYPYRADSLDLTLGDGTLVRLRPVGERLGVTWVRDDETVPEVLMDRAAPPVVPDSLRGDWMGTPVDGADAPFLIRLGADTIGFDHGLAAPVRVAAGLLLATDGEQDVEMGVIRTYHVFAMRADGAALVLDDRRDAMRLVRP